MPRRRTRRRRRRRRGAEGTWCCLASRVPASAAAAAEEEGWAGAGRRPRRSSRPPRTPGQAPWRRQRIPPSSAWRRTGTRRSGRKGRRRAWRWWRRRGAESAVCRGALWGRPGRRRRWWRKSSASLPWRGAEAGTRGKDSYGEWEILSNNIDISLTKKKHATGKDKSKFSNCLSGTGGGWRAIESLRSCSSSSSS